MPNTNNIGAGKPAIAGGIYAMPSASISSSNTLPTDATTLMSTMTYFKSLGFISEDGVTNGFSPETEDTKSWDGATVNSNQTGRPDTFKFKMLEVLNVEVLKLIYGADNVTESSGHISIEATTDEMVPYAFVIDMLIGTRAKRIVIPNAKITDLAEITYKGSEVAGYEITITAMPDPAVTTKSVTHHDYIA